jgi:hypothetical protein
MEFVIFKFPDPVRDGNDKVEETYCDLLSRKRSGENLNPEQLDWMDWANTVLTQ